MAKQQLLGDIFTAVRGLKTDAEKTAYLRANASKALFYFLKLAFNRPTWVFPEGAPPYAPATETTGRTPSHLARELSTVWCFLAAGGSQLPQLRREKLFKRTLESIDAAEVKLLLAAKDGDFGKKYKISEELVEVTFPGLLSCSMSLRFIRS